VGIADVGKNLVGLRDWHTAQAPRYEALGRKVAGLIEDVLKAEGIEFQAVSYRTKSWDSYRNKALDYSDPKSEIYDFCGIRIVTYDLNEVARVSRVIKGLFNADPALTKDKGEELGSDRVGYRAMHLVCTLSEPRASMQEWVVYRQMRFEVQVSTILGHAWAQFEHDRGYKSPVGKLPPELERRMKLAAGLLEIADRELNEIGREVARYQKTLSRRVPAGSARVLSSIGLDSISVRRLLTDRLPQAIKAGVVVPFWQNSERSRFAIEELRAFGVKNLADLDALLPPDFDAKFASEKYPETGLLGVCRLLMFIADPERYFADAWQHHWDVYLSSTVDLVASFGVDLEPYLEQSGIERV